MSTAEQLDAILFEDSAVTTYAILDGASIPDLLDHIDSLSPEQACLYRGELKDGIEEVVPYLVQLEPGHAFTKWLLSNGWGQHYGVFLFATEPLNAIRLHLRRSLRVYTEEGRAYHFRYYDPRVLRAFVPSMTPEESKTFFGPVQAFLCEAEDASNILRFSLRGDRTRRETRGVDSVHGWRVLSD